MSANSIPDFISVAVAILVAVYLTSPSAEGMINCFVEVASEAWRGGVRRGHIPRAIKLSPVFTQKPNA